MSKQRIVKDEIWDDEWFYDLDPSEKLVWLFLLTNQRNNIAGVYQLNRRWGANSVGLDRDVFETIITRFEKDKKIKNHEEWVCLQNFHKHQSHNPKVETGVLRILESLPTEIAYILPIDSLCIAYPTLLNSTLLNLTLPTEAVPPSKSVKEEKESKISFGEFQNVRLADEEHTKLCSALTEPIVQSLIAELDGYIESTGKRYKSHYATLQNWARRRIQEHAVKIQSTKPKMI